jgi:hypothetical protein
LSKARISGVFFPLQSSTNLDLLPVLPSATAFPPELTPVTGGTLAFRQHRGGHDNRDNWPSFIDFAVRELGK